MIIIYQIDTLGINTYCLNPYKDLANPFKDKENNDVNILLTFTQAINNECGFESKMKTVFSITCC